MRAFVDPLGTLWSLSSVVGLLILQGAFVLITSTGSRVVNSVGGSA